MQANVFVFGDQTVPFDSTLHDLLQVKDNPILIDYIEKVGYHLRRYVSSLSVYQQDWFPSFTTLVDLFARHDKSHACPALKFAFVVATQIGLFIKHLEDGSSPYPTDHTYVIGACTGCFAAAAISTSRTLTELVPAAVEAVLVALQTAVRALTLRDDLIGHDEEHKAWSALVAVNEAVAEELVQKFNTEKTLPRVMQLYVSSISNCVTISGPPGLLPQFLLASALKHSVLPIEIPYHAPHLFSGDDAGGFHHPSLQGYAQRLPIVSAASGVILESQRFEDLLHGAVTETLTHPIQWIRLVSSLSRELSAHDFTDCTFYCVQHQGSFLASSLAQQLPSLTVTTTSINEGPLPSSPESEPTGRFSDSKIAIIGYSGRFPDSASNEEFWSLLLAGRDVHRTIPEDRFDWERHYDATGKKRNTSRIKYGCFIKEPGVFDARFFSMSVREAENTDPCQRLGLTTAFEAIEMAGLVPNSTPSTQQDRIGVFYGMTSDDWREVNSGQNVDTYFIPGGNRAFLSGRISYFFRFCGPSLSIDTACSSSFAAIQTACAYLWRGECDTALAGGVNVLTNPDNFAGLDRGHFLTTKGNCNAFDDGADGYCRSDCVASILLKRLDDALSDNDPIFGVIRGTCTNHCGRTDSITRPFEGDQIAVFNRILRYTGTDPREVEYVEMHGTGTQAGDATEMKSVLSVFAPEQPRKKRLYLGAAKANMGHAESASGVASLIKVLLMLKFSTIPPHCGIKTKINHTYPTDWEERNVHIPMKATDWNKRKGEKRLVFLNNFSAAGGNTALLVEDAPERSRPGEDKRTRHVVAATAKTAKSLQEVSLSRLSYTTTARRMHHSFRVLVSGGDAVSIRERLQESVAIVHTVSPKSRIVMVFSGQGTLYAGMGQQLFDAVPSFRDCILRLNSIAQSQGFPPFLPIIQAISEDPSPVADQLSLVCLQMALYNFWTSLGGLPVATIGHSLGEYAALYAAGVLTASDVIYLVGTRAMLFAEKTRPRTHGMLVIKKSVQELQLELNSCEIACFNQPESNVVSGSLGQLYGLKQRLDGCRVACTMMDVPYAFHSAQVNPMLKEFEVAASRIRYRPPRITYISSLLATVVSAGDASTLNGEYLTKACRQPVNFQGAIQAAGADLVDENTIWLELGSHTVCSGMIKGILSRDTLTVPSLLRDTDTWAVITGGLEVLYNGGVEINWSEYHRPWEHQQEVLALPRYAWDLKKYWILYRNNFCLTKGDGVSSVEKAEPPYLSPSVQQVLEESHGDHTSTLLAASDIHDARLAPILTGHVVHGTVLCPSSLYADVALTIARHMTQSAKLSLDIAGLDVAEMKIQNPLISQDVPSQLYYVSATANWQTRLVSCRLFSGPKDKETEHATFCIRITETHSWLNEWRRNTYLIQSRINALQESAHQGNAHHVKRKLAYQIFAQTVEYGSNYHGMQDVVFDAEEYEATVLVSFQSGDNGFIFNPCWIDSLGHVAGFVMNSDVSPGKPHVFINQGWERMRCPVPMSMGKTYRVYNKMQVESGMTYVGDTYILEEGTVIGLYEGVRFQGIPRRVLERVLSGGASERRAPPPVTHRQHSPAHEATKPDAAARVMSIIAAESGLALADLSPKDEFTNHGIDSLLSLTICGRIQEEVGIEVSSSLFTEYPTPKDLITHLAFLSGSPTINTPSSSETMSGYLTGVTEPTASGSTSIMDLLRSTIASETGASINEINPTTPFSELGVDSLLALTITSTLAETLEIEIPSTALTDCHNLSELNKSLGLIIPPPDLPAPQPPTAVPSSNPSSGPQSTSILLWGNPKNSSKTLFFFPDGSGSATSYAHIPKVPNTAAYALNCPYMKTPHKMTHSLESLTAKYLLEIRRRQPTGPYHLAGWSAGGICAYEAARQLHSAGQDTSRIILIDAPNPIGLQNPPAKMYDFFEQIGIFGRGSVPDWLRPHFDAFILLLDAYKMECVMERKFRT
ncbi:Type I Iterative Polyketide synthase (PKS) [Aspergillus melleus]|uniref:Type I Iterative Polyketide synthase (PKS) n=1 Tax=Aspergillus melleus TaxID=138277 RepID=A0ACC3BB51_9EURO|nr:Type I Iterative Polyketide synthase (PKS) [Aspergillus melleus]